MQNRRRARGGAGVRGPPVPPPAATASGTDTAFAIRRLRGTAPNFAR